MLGGKRLNGFEPLPVGRLGVLHRRLHGVLPLLGRLHRLQRGGMRAFLLRNTLLQGAQLLLGGLYLLLQPGLVRVELGDFLLPLRFLGVDQ